MDSSKYTHKGIPYISFDALGIDTRLPLSKIAGMRVTRNNFVVMTLPKNQSNLAKAWVILNPAKSQSFNTPVHEINVGSTRLVRLIRDVNSFIDKHYGNYKEQTQWN